MPTNPNMKAIQTVTVGAGGAASIDFTNIPQTYTDLVIKLSGRSTDSGSVASIRFNGSTANLSGRWLVGTGSSALSGSDSPNYIRINPSVFTANTFGNSEIYITNYTSSNNKSFSQDGVSENNATEAYANFIAGLWSNSAAITSITLIPSLGNFAQYSTATLYGVTSAGYGAKATGGIITENNNYYYHIFTSSGTFTPTVSQNFEIMSSGGGGGGGWERGGGGGAGELDLFTSHSLTASTNYTVTVGGGGAGGSSSAKGGTGSTSSFASLVTSLGGGGGGSDGSTSALAIGANGGSGGGGCGGNPGFATSFAGGTASGSNTFAGGTAYINNNKYNGGGGGGATAVGSDGTNNGTTAQGGNGGAGKTLTEIDSGFVNFFSFAGMTAINAGGGGGSLNNGGTPAAGGTSVGGGTGGSSSSSGNVAPTAATSYGSGGGGGAGAATPTSGYQGIVIVRYAK